MYDIGRNHWVAVSVAPAGIVAVGVKLTKIVVVDRGLWSSMMVVELLRSRAGWVSY